MPDMALPIKEIRAHSTKETPPDSAALDFIQDFTKWIAQQHIDLDRLDSLRSTMNMAANELGYAAMRVTYTKTGVWAWLIPYVSVREEHKVLAVLVMRVEKKDEDAEERGIRQDWHL